MPLAFSYVRFSEARQAKGSSTHVQDTTAEEWCKGNGCDLDNRSYRGMGVSAFTGEHRKNPDRHGLALFLNALKDGKIPEDSFLLLYNLDRLTREDIRPAYALFNEILSHRVHIVQLRPEHVFRWDTSGPEAMFDILTAIMELSRGNSESRIKSERIKANWQRVREGAKTDDLPRHKNGKVGLPGKTPFWLTKTKDGYEKNDKAEAVKRMFQLARDGYGMTKVANLVNEEFRLDLSRPYVRNLLTGHQNRKVLGEWQPRDKNGNPIGESFVVYPPAISLDEWDAAQGAISGRNNGSSTRKRDGKRVYLFNEFMRDVDTYGTTFTPVMPSKNLGQLKFIPVAYLDGKRACISFPVEAFEDAILGELSEVNPADVLPKKGKNAVDELSVLNGKRAQLKAKIDEGTAALDETPSKALAGKLAQWESEVAELDEVIARVRQKAKCPPSEAWAEAKNLVSLVHKGDEATRQRFRSVAAGIVNEMKCLFFGHRSWRLAFVAITFQESAHVRNVVICYRTKANTFQGVRPDVLIVDSWREAPELTPTDGEGRALIRRHVVGMAEDYETQERERKKKPKQAKA